MAAVLTLTGLGMLALCYRTCKSLKTPVDIAVERIDSSVEQQCVKNGTPAPASVSKRRRRTLAPSALLENLALSLDLLRFWCLFGTASWMVNVGLVYAAELRLVLVVLSLLRLEGWVAFLFERVGQPLWGTYVPRLWRRARTWLRRAGALLAPGVRQCCSALLPAAAATAGCALLLGPPTEEETLLLLEESLIAASGVVTAERRARRRAHLLRGLPPSDSPFAGESAEASVRGVPPLPESDDDDNNGLFADFSDGDDEIGSRGVFASSKSPIAPDLGSVGRPAGSPGASADGGGALGSGTLRSSSAPKRRSEGVLNRRPAR